MQESEGKAYISRKLLKEKGIKKVTISSEPDYVDTEYEGKPTGQKMTYVVKTDVLDPQEAVWQMNKATNNFLTKLWGTETKDWIGKEVEICTKQAGNMTPSVYPVDCSLEKVIT